jgi:hypothetical protein
MKQYADVIHRTRQHFSDVGRRELFELPELEDFPILIRKSGKALAQRVGPLFGRDESIGRNRRLTPGPDVGSPLKPFNSPQKRHKHLLCEVVGVARRESHRSGGPIEATGVLLDDLLQGLGSEKRHAAILGGRAEKNVSPVSDTTANKITAGLL